MARIGSGKRVYIPNQHVYPAVGAYCIRPTNATRRWRKRVRISMYDVYPAVGAYCIRPINATRRWQKRVRILMYGMYPAVGAYCIRPTNATRRWRKRVRIPMDDAYPVRKTCPYFQSPSPKTTHNMTVIRPHGAVCGAYAIRPYNWGHTVIGITGPYFQLPRGVT